jgi:hypothetical protein
MHLFRWIVKLIRDEYGIDESVLTRTAVLEKDIGLSLENIERVLEYISDSFQIRFPDGTLDEVLRLEELCLLSAWLKGLYKCPPFIGDDFAAACRGLNPEAGA